ncbi:LLM class flavin-dependent oxidoreductase [Kineococcus arenarius]|uniref:LLM class flavin-dependent oxidoreductase n=1 Tax=unclassified Kineococcus TaxID=2621656 RepID=UPI003D7DF171
MPVDVAVQFTFTGPPLTRRDAEEVVELAAAADDCGLHSIGTGDTGFRLNEAASRVTLLALGARRCHVGMRPTNPWTRHPQLAAALLATVDALTGGHAFVEVATGDSSVTSVGRRPASRARLEEYVRCVRDLLAHGEAQYEGRTVRCFTERPTPARISIGAEGPKMLHLAGRIGDAVSIGTGLTPEVVEDSLARVRAGALAEGRPPGSVEPWFTVRSCLHRDPREARRRLLPSLASILHHSMRAGVEGRHVPERHRTAVEEFVARYALADHQRAGGANEELVDRLGLADFAHERWGLAGDADGWVERLRQLQDVGVDRVWLANRGTVREVRDTLVQFRDEVLPRLR